MNGVKTFALPIYGMTPARDQQSASIRRKHGGAQIDAGYGSTRSLADAFLIHRDDDSGAARFLLKAARHDADDAGMTARTGDQCKSTIAQRLQQSLRLFLPQRFEGAPLFV